MFDFLQKNYTNLNRFPNAFKIKQKNLKDDKKQRIVNVSAYNFDPLYSHQMLMGFLFILIRVLENISNIKNMFNKLVIHNIQFFFPRIYL
jgi:hypothetical protein